VTSRFIDHVAVMVGRFSRAGKCCPVALRSREVIEGTWETVTRSRSTMPSTPESVEIWLSAEVTSVPSVGLLLAMLSVGSGVPAADRDVSRRLYPKARLWMDFGSQTLELAPARQPGHRDRRSRLVRATTKASVGTVRAGCRLHSPAEPRILAFELTW